jgi:zinc protease
VDKWIWGKANPKSAHRLGSLRAAPFQLFSRRMTSLFLRALALLALLATPAAAQRSAIRPVPLAQLVEHVRIPYEEFTLDNGLRVVVHTDRKAPIVAVNIWYDVGSKHEPRGKTGFAHLFEHLMFNGSENAPGDYQEPLRQLGATGTNGTTSFDRTNYYQTVPTAGLERVLFLESDRMGWMLGAVTQAVLDEQRGVVQNEKRQGDNAPYGLVRYRLYEGLFAPGHPYSHATIGSMADLDAASVEDVHAWFRAHYGPNNAVLVLAGDIDAATARPLVEKHFGRIARGPASMRPAIEPTPLAAPRRETLQDRVANTRIYRAWPVPGLNHPDSVPLEIGAAVLGGLSSSRLDNILVRKEKLAVGAGTSVNSLAQGGMFVVSVTVKPGIEPTVVEKRLDEIIAGLLRQGPLADEVGRVATSAVSGSIAGLESVGGSGGKAAALAEGALYSNDPGFFRKQLLRFASVTPSRVRSALARWLRKPAYSLTVAPGAREAYADAGAPPAATPPAPAARAAATRPEPFPAVGEIGDLDFPDVTRTRLSNGVEVIYAHRDAVPVTQLSIAFDAGAVADPDKRLGTQSLMLSLIDEGTARFGSIALAEAQERLGAQIGGGSSADRTYLWLFSPTPNLGGALDVFADVVRNPLFAANEFERVRAQILAAIQQELTSPGGLAGRKLPELLYAGTPYAKLAAGSGDPDAIKLLSRDDLIAFHRAWIRPDKARIFVVSNAPLAALMPQIEARFGNWQGQGTPGTKPARIAPTPPRPRIVLIDRPDSPQSIIVAGQMTSLSSATELLPVLTANEVLGGNFLSRINQDLRETKHWSYGARGSFSRLEGAVPYIINAPVQADKTGAAIESLRTVLRDFLSTGGITEAEFARTINGRTRELPASFETSTAVLSAMQTNDLYGRPDDYYDLIAKKYRALTRGQLDAAARAAITPDGFVWVVVGDASKVRGQLDSLGLPVEVIAATPVVPPIPAAAAGAP